VPAHPAKSGHTGVGVKRIIAMYFNIFLTVPILFLSFLLKAQQDTIVANRYFNKADSLTKYYQYDSANFYYQKASDIYLALATSVETSPPAPSPLVERRQNMEKQKSF